MRSLRFARQRIKKLRLKKHSRTSKCIIAFVIISLFTYTTAAIWLQLKIGVEVSPTLTTCFFAFCTGELWLLATIKKTKINNGQKARAYDTEIENYKGEATVENSDGEAKG